MHSMITSFEKALLTDLRLGLPEAVTVWYKKYGPVIEKYVSRKIDNTRDVEEVVRDTFVNCLRHLPLFQEQSTLKTWMISIANHEVADYYRKRYAKKFIVALPLTHLLFEESPKNMHETSEIVSQALSALRDDYRELLMLKYVDQYSVKDIAEKFGRTIKSIESDLFRARSEFRAVYSTLDQTS